MTPKQTFSCDACERDFSSREILNTHLAAHVEVGITTHKPRNVFRSCNYKYVIQVGGIYMFLMPRLFSLQCEHEGCSFKATRKVLKMHRLQVLYDWLLVCYI